MSSSYSGLFGPRYEPPPNHHIRDPYQDPGFGQTPTTTAFHLPFPNYTPPTVVSNQIEWTETPQAHVYKAHLPGLKHNEVKVEVDDGRVLCISGEKTVEKEENTGRWHHVERARGKFLQSLTLPENSKVDHVKAYMDNGVLTINVPKNQVVSNRHHARTRNINISGR